MATSWRLMRKITGVPILDVDVRSAAVDGDLQNAETIPCARN